MAARYLCLLTLVLYSPLWSKLTESKMDHIWNSKVQNGVSSKLMLFIVGNFDPCSMDFLLLFRNWFGHVRKGKPAAVVRAVSLSHQVTGLKHPLRRFCGGEACLVFSLPQTPLMWEPPALDLRFFFIWTCKPFTRSINLNLSTYTNKYCRLILLCKEALDT